MSTQNTRSSGRRSRGPRRRPDRDRDRDRDSRPSSTQSAPKEPVKKSFWQKVLAFFGLGKSKGSGSAKAPARPASSVTSSYPATAPAPRPARKPEAVEVTSTKLYVGNLSFDATESDLFELFAGIGSVRSAEIVTHKHNEKSKGFGFVTMSTLDEAKRAVEVLHDKEFMTRKLVVSGAKTPAERS